MRTIMLATSNAGKAARYRGLLADATPAVTLALPSELGIDDLHPDEEGATLSANAEIKARAYFGKVNVPILANDTGFYVEGEGFVEAPKRISLDGVDERSLSTEEIARRMLVFWQGIAVKYGGKVDAAWIDAFVLLLPDGTMRTAEARRDVVLTDQIFGVPHPQLPVRALYISQVTNTPAVLHTQEEERLELAPITDALRGLLL